MEDKSPTETMNIALPEMLKDFVHEQVTAKGYTSASEYVRELIRAAQEKAMWEEIEQLAIEGLKSGPATEMTKADWDDLKERVVNRLESNQDAHAVRRKA